MARKKTADTAGLYADAFQLDRKGGPTVESLILQAALQGKDISASLRHDLAGAPISVMRNPVTYQQKVVRMWEAYATDPLFQRLVNRSVDFIANGSYWRVREDTDAEPNWLNRIKNWFGKGSKTTESIAQQDIWNAWSDQINMGVQNTPQGINEIVAWAARHFLLSGAFVPHWQWGSFQHGKKTLLMPTQLTCYPSSMVTLSRTQQQFSGEKIFLSMPGQRNSPMTGMPIEAPQMAFGSTAGLIPLENLGEREDVRLGQTEAFYLKYQWSPGDMSTTRFGNMFQTAWDQYPTPPFISLLQTFALRQKLGAGDLALADAVANYQRVFSIGDKEHPPIAAIRDRNGRITKNGTIGEIKAMIEAHMANPAMALYLPFWVQYKEMIPDVGKLLTEEKYVYSDVQIMMAFGIIASRSAASRNERFETLNIAGFEEMLESIRRLIASWLYRLSFRIVEANPSTLKTPATWHPYPLNTKTEVFKKSLLEIAKMGKISTKSLVKYYGLDDDVELRQIANDLARRADDVYDDNVPVTFAQKTTDGAGQPGESTPNTDGSPSESAPTGPRRRNRKRTKITTPPGETT